MVRSKEGMVLQMSISTSSANGNLTERSFNTGGGTLVYDDDGGSGPLIIALPGMGDLRQEYR